METRQAFWAELGTFYGPLSVKVGPGPLPSPSAWKEKAATSLPATAGKLGWVPSVGRVGTCVEERQDRGGRSPRPDHQHAWDPGQETGLISHDLSQQHDVTSCFRPFQALPVPQGSSTGVLTPLQVFQAVVALAAPLCISLTSMPMALGTSAVQAWLPCGSGHLGCAGLASLCHSFPVLPPPCHLFQVHSPRPGLGPGDSCLLPTRAQCCGISRAARSCSRAC